MNCPRCSQEAIPSAPQCPGCGFALQTLDAHFGVNSVVLDRIIDAAHCLKLREKEMLEGRLRTFERLFPQLFASVYIGTLPGWTSVSEFGFWLLNRGSVSTSGDSSRSNHYTFLLVLDPDSQAASVTAGYGAENILQPKALTRAVEKARLAWRSGEFADGIGHYLLRLSKAIRKANRRIPGAHRTAAEQLDTLPPPDLSHRPVPAPGSRRSDILEGPTQQATIPLGPQAIRPAASSKDQPNHHRLDLTGGIAFASSPTATAS